jgi:hypothetical protein
LRTPIDAFGFPIGNNVFSRLFPSLQLMKQPWLSWRKNFKTEVLRFGDRHERDLKALNIKKSKQKHYDTAVLRRRQPMRQYRLHGDK